MRKQNSEFETKFMSEAGTQLLNSDYFAFVELDKYSCWVIADGIDTHNEYDAKAAKMAVDRILTAFQANPSMRKSRIEDYLREGNSELLLHNKLCNLKASVTMVITDYVKLRYAEIGNTRFKVYRDGFVLEESKDQSLSEMMADEEDITRDKIATHEERNNLYTYLGQNEAFFHQPFISKKVKLKDSDIITLCTRGIWEVVDGVDFDDVFTDTGDDPQKPLDLVEDMILQVMEKDQNREIYPYTLVAIFVNKVYRDPNRKKKIKRILLIVGISLLVIIILTVVIILWTNHRKKQREEMDMAISQAIEYMNDNNFIKAAEELKTAESLAKKLWDKKVQIQVGDYTLLCGAINDGNTAMDSGDYEEAEECFNSAEKRSRYADNLGQAYIEKKLTKARDYIDVQKHLYIGDTYLDTSDFDNARLSYENAKRLASSINFANGRQQAVDALEKLARTLQELNEEGVNSAKEEVAAADLAIQGDTALKDGDYTAAQAYYTAAKEKYEELGNNTLAESVARKLEAVEKKQAENDDKQLKADEYMAEGDRLAEESSYWKAKQQYLLARQIYNDLKHEDRLTEVQEKIAQMDFLITEFEENSKKAA